MVRDIVKDPLFLAQKSKLATKADLSVGRDLQDTLKAHRDACVGMAANMIGERKCILICAIGPGQLILVNPEIVHREGAYETREGCLCHEGERPVKRYRSIRVKYFDEQFQPQERTFLGFPAQIIQHEMDHFEGKLI